MTVQELLDKNMADNERRKKARLMKQGERINASSRRDIDLALSMIAPFADENGDLRTLAHDLAHMKDAETRPEFIARGHAMIAEYGKRKPLRFGNHKHAGNDALTLMCMALAVETSDQRIYEKLQKGA